MTEQIKAKAAGVSREIVNIPFKGFGEYRDTLDRFARLGMELAYRDCLTLIDLLGYERARVVVNERLNEAIEAGKRSSDAEEVHLEESREEELTNGR